MTVAPQLQSDPAERGLRLLAEMIEEAAAVRASERPILRVVEADEQ